MLDMHSNRLISHAIATENLEVIIKQKKEKIIAKGDQSNCTVAEQLQLLEELSQFDFGRYLLQNQGINGFWTHYMLTYPWYGAKTGKNNAGETFTALERFILERAPTLLATQQRFEIFLQENQKSIKNNAKLACIPCGMMGELLYLDFQAINQITLIGIDYDKGTFKDAHQLAEKKDLSKFVEFIHRDAWQLEIQDAFDLISSNGLNIYEPDAIKVSKLYSQFYQALKKGGKLVTSFLTYPPTLSPQCEWDMSQLNLADLRLQKIIFADVLEAKFRCYSTSEATKMQLAAAGFRDIEFIYDAARIFPTVVAYK